MNLFQSLTISALAVALIVELIGLARKSTGKKQRLVSAAVWLAAAGAIFDPDLLQTLANKIGIGRGAVDFVEKNVNAFLHFQGRFLRQLRAQRGDRHVGQLFLLRERRRRRYRRALHNGDLGRFVARRKPHRGQPDLPGLPRTSALR